MGNRPAREARNPFVEFVKPGRRRTDHPWVVGTVVLCLGLTTLGQILTVAALFWLGGKVAAGIEAERRRDGATENMRDTIIKNAAAQENILRRLCLNSARTVGDQNECLTLVPPITPTPQGRTRN